MRNLTLPTKRLDAYLADPIIVKILGTGKSAYIWIGNKRHGYLGHAKNTWKVRRWLRRALERMEIKRDD